MSSSDVAVSVRGLSKSYTIAHNAENHSTAAEALMHRLKNPLSKPETETFWALKDVDFDILKGDVVGIIGRNGAGKSTLLKILSRITEPTTGQIDLYGRVGSLLEVGTGFHPELTGRENVYLNGAILGMQKSEIARQFDAIVDFSGTEQFLDTPVKRYSSGMYVRLAFAVAAHLNPEILIIDEVLAVGDAEFQKKCLGKMQDVADSGRTVLFVSHNMTAVQTLCSRAIWLSKGAVVAEGLSSQIVPDYFNKTLTSVSEQIWDDPETAPGDEKVRLHRIYARPSQGDASDAITVRTPITLDFEYWNLQPDTYLNLSIDLYNKDGIRVLNTFSSSDLQWQGKPFSRGLHRSSFKIPGDLLNDGVHRVDLMVVENQGTVLFRLEDALVFEVHDANDLRGDYHGEWSGAVRPNLKWQTESVDETERSMAYR